MSQIDWKAFARVFDVFSSEDYAPVLHFFYVWIVDQLEARGREPQRFLEIGGGTGLLAAKLVEWYPEAQLVLVDSSPEMLEVARERFGQNPSVRIVEASGEAHLQSLEPESLEVAVFCRAWYTMSEPEKTAAALVRALEPGGLAFVFDFTQPLDFEALDATFQEAEPELWPIARAAYRDFNQGIESGRYHLYSEPQMRELWRQAGAEMVDYASFEPEKHYHQLCVEKR